MNNIPVQWDDYNTLTFSSKDLVFQIFGIYDLIGQPISFSRLFQDTLFQGFEYTAL